MFYAFSWLVVVVLAGLWSLSVWALHALAVWAISNAGVWSGAAADLGVPGLPADLMAWLPPQVAAWIGSVLTGLGPAMERLLQTVPALADGLTVVTWVVWSLGTAALVALGLGLHLLIALWRRQARPAVPTARPLTAG